MDTAQSKVLLPWGKKTKLSAHTVKYVTFCSSLNRASQSLFRCWLSSSPLKHSIVSVTGMLLDEMQYNLSLLKKDSSNKFYSTMFRARHSAFSKYAFVSMCAPFLLLLTNSTFTYADCCNILAAWDRKVYSLDQCIHLMLKTRLPLAWYS